MTSMKLKEYEDTLRTYSGEKLPVLGVFDTQVSYNGQTATLPMIVADDMNQPPFFGRNWMAFIRLDWQSIFKVLADGDQLGGVNGVCFKHSAVFIDGLGTITTHKAKFVC